MDGYWHVARTQAEKAIVAAGLTPAAPRSLRPFAELTGIDLPPTDVQRWAAGTELPDGPLLVLIEDVTGGGRRKPRSCWRTGSWRWDGR